MIFQNKLLYDNSKYFEYIFVVKKTTYMVLYTNIIAVYVISKSTDQLEVVLEDLNSNEINIKMTT